MAKAISDKVFTSTRSSYLYSIQRAQDLESEAQGRVGGDSCVFQHFSTWSAPKKWRMRGGGRRFRRQLFAEETDVDRVMDKGEEVRR